MIVGRRDLHKLANITDSLLTCRQFCWNGVTTSFCKIAPLQIWIYFLRGSRPPSPKVQCWSISRWPRLAQWSHWIVGWERKARNCKSPSRWSKWLASDAILAPKWGQHPHLDFWNDNSNQTDSEEQFEKNLCPNLGSYHLNSRVFKLHHYISKLSKHYLNI